MTHSAGPVQSIDRVLDLVELLSDSPSGMLLRELAGESALHISTVHRLLNSLIERGYARKDLSSNRYCLTLRLFEVGCKVSGAMDLLALARPWLDDLSDFSQEAVHLGKPDGADIVYLYKALPVQMLVRMASYVGGRNPLYCTGMGKAILAYLDSGEAEKIWKASHIRPITPRTIVSFRELTEQLSLIRQQGYAIDNEENETGVFCLAAPIFNWRGTPIAAVSISAPLARMTPDVIKRILPRLLQTTGEISCQFGFCRRPQSE